MSTVLAVESVGKVVLVIKDNTVIGRGKTVISSNYKVGIEMIDEATQKLIAGETSDLLGFKHVHPRFSEITGMFITSGFIDSDIDAKLDGVYVVDEHNFGYGWVPEFFKTVEGCGQRIKDIEKEYEDSLVPRYVSGAVIQRICKHRDDGLMYRLVRIPGKRAVVVSLRDNLSISTKVTSADEIVVAAARHAVSKNWKHVIVAADCDQGHSQGVFNADMYKKYVGTFFN